MPKRKTLVAYFKIAVSGLLLCLAVPFIFIGKIFADLGYTVDRKRINYTRYHKGMKQYRPGFDWSQNNGEA